MSSNKKTSILLLPFTIVWAIFSFVMKLTGRVLAALIGLVCIAIGIFLSVTLVAAPVGIPLVIFGILLLIRSIF
ncbi:MAG TPA: hypothetical protein VMM58_13635 [Bacteroidota bacterium]|nr:hypothetical protein [Bacteroidota bacterium]